MADPIIPNAVRVQAIFQGASGLPEDRYVNTFAFLTNAAVTSAHIAEALTVVEQFYNVDHAGAAGGPLISYYPGVLINEAQSELRAYDLSDAPPREPTTVTGWPGTMSLAVGLPQEVAVCMSYYSERNIPRRRGRIYLGPLSQEVNTGTQPPGRPSTEFLTVVQAAGQFLVDYNGTVAPAVVAIGDNPATKTALPITHGWVDNAWDTQRRRGSDASTRLEFAAT